jgi:large subunit ribosomal protein L23
MGILDRIKGKKEEPKKVSKKKDENVLDMVQESETAKPLVLKENTGLAHRILKNYHLSEKTNVFSATGRYVFKVDRDANKIEVKKAIEKVYDVHVAKVNMVNVLGKKRRQGRTMGRTQDWKKAIVTLRAGEKISGLAEGV